MTPAWKTDEVVRWLTSEADLDEVRDIIEEAGSDGLEALAEWVRKGNAPKGLYDAVLRFTTDPQSAFDTVDWETVVTCVLSEKG